MNVLKEGWKKAVNSVKEHPWLLVLLILLQIAVFVSVLTIIIVYPVKILQNVEGIMTTMQNVNYNVTSIQAGSSFASSQDLLTVYNSYNDLIKNITAFLSWSLGVLLILQAGIWIFTNRLFVKKTEKFNFWGELKRFGMSWCKYLLITLVLFLLPAVVFYFIINSLFTLQLEDSVLFVVQLLSVVFLIIYYFSLVGFSLLTLPWKEFFKNFIRISFKKIHWNLLVLIINSIFIGVFVYLIYLTVTLDQHYWLTVLASIILIPLLTLLRIFWVGCVQSMLNPTHTIPLTGASHEKNLN